MGSILLLAAFCLPLFGLVLLLFLSPGKPEPIVDARGKPLARSLAEKVYVDIHGVRQGMFIKSADLAQPVLLYVHGGMPDYFLTKPYPTRLEQTFTVVWWEQRGSGISYDREIPPETMTVEQLIRDVLAVTDHLRRRFQVPKIYLMGHSGGTFIGIQAAARSPERYHAYIGVAQMSHQRESERLAYEYMLQQFRARGDRSMVAKLEAAPVTPSGELPRAYLAIRDPAMHRLGVGTMREMRSLLTGLVLPSLAFPEYTLREKLSLWFSKSRSGVSIVWRDMLATDLRQSVTNLDLPVYFLHGRHDYTVNYALAKRYLDVIDAPVKGFYSFDASAHSPMFEQPERVNRILREDVLTAKVQLADQGPED